MRHIHPLQPIILIILIVAMYYFRKQQKANSPKAAGPGEPRAAISRPKEPKEEKTPEAVYMGPNRRAFGHHGLGGSIGFGDPDAKLGFSYCCNQMHAVGTNGPRARRLIDAVYGALS